MVTRVLVVEDEDLLRGQLEEFLLKNGFEVDLAGDGVEGLFMAQRYAYEIAVIDLGLPKLTGIEVIKQLRNEGKELPILILTARTDWQDKVEGLQVGADDYLVKPFHVQELLARINALVRRASGKLVSQMEFGPIKVNTRAKKVEVNGTQIELTAFEYNLLEYLMLHPGEVISKSELTEHLYEQDFDRDSNVIEVFVGRLRKKLDPENKLKPIETMRGQGYRLEIQQG